MATYIQVDEQNEVINIVRADTPPDANHYVATSEQIAVLKNSRFGHAVFDYVGGELVKVQAREDAQITEWNDRVVDRELINSPIFRAFVDTLLDEINILRSSVSLPERTLDQLKTTIKNKVDTE